MDGSRGREEVRALRGSSLYERGKPDGRGGGPVSAKKCGGRAGGGGVGGRAAGLEQEGAEGAEVLGLQVRDRRLAVADDVEDAAAADVDPVLRRDEHLGGVEAAQRAAVPVHEAQDRQELRHVAPDQLLAHGAQRRAVGRRAHVALLERRGAEDEVVHKGEGVALPAVEVARDEDVAQPHQRRVPQVCPLLPRAVVVPRDPHPVHLAQHVGAAVQLRHRLVHAARAAQRPHLRLVARRVQRKERVVLVHPLRREGRAGVLRVQHHGRLGRPRRQVRPEGLVAEEVGHAASGEAPASSAPNAAHRVPEVLGLRGALEELLLEPLLLLNDARRLCRRLAKIIGRCIERGRKRWCHGWREGC